MAKMKIKINRERLLLVTLVATAFFGFIWWTNQQIIVEEQSLPDIFLNASILASPRSNSLKISSPRPNDAIKSPLLISGQAANAEGRLKARLKDSRGLVLGETFFWIKNDSAFHPFSVNLVFKKPTSNKGTLEIFQARLKDNAEINKVSLPVRFQN